MSLTFNTETPGFFSPESPEQFISKRLEELIKDSRPEDSWAARLSVRNAD